MPPKSKAKPKTKPKARKAKAKANEPRPTGRPVGWRKWNGAPTRLTQELCDEIVKLVEVGNYFETACQCAGVPAATGRQWLRKGANAETRDGLYARFRAAYMAAEAKAEASAVVRVRQHGTKSWQADAWFLERKIPKRWGRGEWRKPQVEVKAGDNAVKIYIPTNGRDDDDVAPDSSNDE